MTQNNAPSVTEPSGAHAGETGERTSGRTIEWIEAALTEKLSSSHVKKLSKGGVSLSYVEAWHAIAEANRIFGHDGWERETIYCKEVCRYERESNGKILNVVGYEAKVRVSALGIIREGTGHGSGQQTDLYDSIESAAKEAESDAMKRAMMTFGNPFGLALYDKKQEGVGGAVLFKNAALRNEYFKKLDKAMEDCSSVKQLEDLWKEHQTTLTQCKNGNEYDVLCYDDTLAKFKRAKENRQEAEDLARDGAKALDDAVPY